MPDPNAHNQESHRVVTVRPGTCTCGTGPWCRDCHLCFNCGRTNLGMPDYRSLEKSGRA